MSAPTPCPYNAQQSFDDWFDGKTDYPVVGFLSKAVGEEIETPCYAVAHHEIEDAPIDVSNVAGTGGGNTLLGRVVTGEARIAAYVGVTSDAYATPEARKMLLMRNELFGLFRFRPVIPIRNYLTDTDFSDLENWDKESIVCTGIQEEPALSDVRDGYLLLEQAFRISYRYVHLVVSA